MGSRPAGESSARLIHRTLRRIVPGLVAVSVGGCGAAMVAPEPAEVAEDPPSLIASLRLEEVPDVERVPQTRVSLAVFDEDSEAVQVHQIDVAAGACSPRRARETELLLVGCWWAGAGVVYSVVHVGDELVVQRQYDEESLGEGPARELPAEEVARVELPRGARVRAL